MQLRLSLSLVASVCASLLLALPAGATPIGPGGSVTASIVQTGNIAVLATYNNVAFTSAAPPGQASTFSGTYTEAVFTDSANTTCGVAGKCLTLAIQVNNSSTSTDGIETVSTGPFSNLFTYNVGYDASNGGLTPSYITDSATGTMSFNFSGQGSTANELHHGESSAYLLIQTSATNFTAGNLSFQDDQTATVAGFSPIPATVPPPTTVTPEPSTITLLGTGLLGLAGMVKRRFV